MEQTSDLVLRIYRPEHDQWCGKLFRQGQEVGTISNCGSAEAVLAEANRATPQAIICSKAPDDPATSDESDPEAVYQIV